MARGQIKFLYPAWDSASYASIAPDNSPRLFYHYGDESIQEPTHRMTPMQPISAS